MALGEKSLFWDKPEGVLTPEELEYYQYNGQDLASYFECMYTTGITPQMAVSNDKDNPKNYIGSSLAVTAGNGLQVVVSPGTAMIKGRPYLLSLPLTFDLADGAVTDILLQSNTQQERPEIKLIARKRPTGLFLVENIKHESLIYEIAIASVDVPAASIQVNPTMITDQRLNTTLHTVDNKPIAGLCQSIPQVNTLGIWEDYQKLDTYIKAVWRTFITNSTNEWATFLANKRNDFDIWFETVKGILSDDVAGNLANEIANLKQRMTTVESNLDTHQKSQTIHVTQFTHTKTGTTHELTGVLPTSGIVTAKFKATADCAEGDTFKINGVDYQAKPTGEETKLPNKAFIVGDIISCEIDIDGKKVNFKLGGSGGFPTSWKDERTAIAREPINKDAAIAMMKYGDVTNQLSYMPMDVPIKAVGTLKVSGNGKILACCDTMHANGSDGIDIYFIDELTNSLIKLPNPSISPSLPKYIAVNDDGRFIVTIERSAIESNNDGLIVRLYKTDTVTSSSIYNHMSAITCTIRSDFTIYNAIIYGDLLYMYVAGVDGGKSWGHYVLVFKISNDGTTLVFVKTTRLDSFGNTYGRMVMSKTGLMLIGYYNQTEEIHHVSLYRITETGLGSKLFDKSNYSSATISLSPMGKNFAIHNNDGSKLELWQFPNYDGGGVPVKIWETPNKYSTVGFLGVDNLLYYITESPRTRVVGIEGAKVTILNDNLTQSESLNDNCDNIKYCVSYRCCYPLTQKSFATNLDSVYAQSALSKNKYLEFGIGIAQETKNTGEQIKVNLFSPINNNLGGLY